MSHIPEGVLQSSPCSVLLLWPLQRHPLPRPLGTIQPQVSALTREPGASGATHEDSHENL